MIEDTTGPNTNYPCPECHKSWGDASCGGLAHDNWHLKLAISKAWDVLQKYGHDEGCLNEEIDKLGKYAKEKEEEADRYVHTIESTYSVQKKLSARIEELENELKGIESQKEKELKAAIQAVTEISTEFSKLVYRWVKKKSDLYKPRTFTLKEVLAGAERAHQRFLKSPKWKQELADGKKEQKKKKDHNWDNSIVTRLLDLADNDSQDKELSEKALNNLAWLVNYAWVIINSDHEETGIHDEWLECFWNGDIINNTELPPVYSRYDTKSK